MSRPGLTRLVKTLGKADELETLASFTKDYPVPERGAQYYLCQGGSCTQPMDSIVEVKTLLAQKGQYEEGWLLLNQKQ